MGELLYCGRSTLASKTEATGFAVNGGGPCRTARCAWVLVVRPIPRRKHLANHDPIGGYRFSERDRAQQNKLRRTPKPQILDLPELAVDAQLDAADREHFDPGFGFAGLDPVADPELPFPHSRDRRHRHRVFDASVIYGKSPPRLTHVNTIQLRIFRYHPEISMRIARGFAASRRELTRRKPPLPSKQLASSRLIRVLLSRQKTVSKKTFWGLDRGQWNFVLPRSNHGRTRMAADLRSAQLRLHADVKTPQDA